MGKRGTNVAKEVTPRKKEEGEMSKRNEDREERLDLLRRGGWKWCPRLEFRRRIESPRCLDRIENRDDAFERWIEEIASEHGGGFLFMTYARVMEPCPTGGVFIHVFLRDVPKTFRPYWLSRWTELSAGTALDRHVDQKLGEAIEALVREKNCDIEWCVAETVTTFAAKKGSREFNTAKRPVAPARLGKKK